MTFALLAKRRKLACWLVSALLTITRSVAAYRQGDSIDTELWTKVGSHEHATKRQQMPIFGIDTRAKFGPLPDRFSISFEEGFRALPWMNLRNGFGVPLEKVEVTFIYSRSGSGEIHSISGNPIYLKGGAAAAADMNNQIIVEYKWAEEEAVDLNGGSLVMFLAVFIISVFVLVDLCGMCDGGDDSSDRYTVPSGEGVYGADVDPLALMGGPRMPKYE